MAHLIDLKDNTESHTQKCGICRKKLGSYTCPRCTIIYCSLACYKSSQHQSCAEGFYRANIIQHLSKGKRIQSDRETAQSQKRLVEILNGFNSKHEQSDATMSENNTWKYQVPDNVKDKIQTIEKEFKSVDLHRSNAIYSDEEEDRPLTREEELELMNLISTADPENLLKNLSPEQQKDFELLLKNNDYVIDSSDDNY